MQEKKGDIDKLAENLKLMVSKKKIAKSISGREEPKKPIR